MATTISTITPISLSSGSNPTNILTTRLYQSNEDSMVKSNMENKKKEDISPAIAVSDSELSCYYVIRYTLNTHKMLSTDDINYAANFISSFYAHSYDLLQQNNGSKDSLLTDDQLIMFLVYSDQNGICKFALTFNEELENAIKNRDEITIKRIILGPKEMFVELYDNNFLSNEDREFIIRLIARESFSALLSLELIKKKIINLEAIDDKCTAETFTATINTNNDKVNITSIATKCYDEVCIQDAKILDDDIGRAIMSKYEKPPESVFTIDKSESSKLPSVYCFNTLELINAITDDIPINPKTGQPFSKYALKLIRERFHKEIDMYRRYKQNKLHDRKI